MVVKFLHLKSYQSSLYQFFPFSLYHHNMKKISFSLLLIFIITGCLKTNFSSDYTDTFEYMWQRINDHYCCFDTSEVDWNAVRAEYAPQISNDMSETTFIELIDEILSLFKDHSLSISTLSGEIRYDEFEQYPPNFDINTITFYNPANHPYVVYDSIAYINDFYEPGNSIKEVANNNMKGLILDFRDLVDVDVPGSSPSKWGLQNIRKEEKDVAIKRKKIGAGADDFEEKTITYDGINQDNAAYEGPIIVLINHQIFGTDNKVVHIASEMSNTTLVGTATGRANFGVASSFLPNGWRLNIPEAAIFDMQGNSIGLGIQPDTIVEDDITTTEIDEVIEAALDMLR